MATIRSKASALPHSWPINDWPPTVYPNRSSSARYMVRAHRDELLSVGALSRVGRELVVIGEGYARVLARRTGQVANYEITPNAMREAA